MVPNVTKIFWKIKNESLLSIETNVIELDFIIIIRKHFNLETLVPL